MKFEKAEGKVVIVTGASSGIGEAIARTYAAWGAKVMLAARNEERLRDVCHSIRLNGGEVNYITVDVSDESATKLLVEQCIKEFGHIDLLICSAGISMRASFADVSLDVMHTVMNVNFWGTINCIKYALPHIVDSKGSIVGISSLAGIHGLPKRSGYSASKYALTGFLETLRIELLKSGVHVMIAYPGYTSSNIRYSALTANGERQGYTPRDEKKMLPAERVASIIIRDVERKKRISLMDFEGRAALLLKRIYPPLLDKLFSRAVQSEEQKC